MPACSRARLHFNIVERFGSLPRVSKPVTVSGDVPDFSPRVSRDQETKARAARSCAGVSMNACLGRLLAGDNADTYYMVFTTSFMYHNPIDASEGLCPVRLRDAFDSLPEKPTGPASAGTLTRP